MRTPRTLLLAAALALPAAPAFADGAGPPRGDQRTASVPTQLDRSERETYRAVFGAIRAQDWQRAAGLLDSSREGPLHHVARAHLFLARGSPRVEVEQIMPLLERAPDLPQAQQLVRLAQTRGATALPSIPEAQRLVGLAGQPRRARARATRGDSGASEIEPLIQQAIVDRRPHDAEQILADREWSLGGEARTEFQQRIAWSYYLGGNDAAARQLADKARRGSGEWTIHAEWVAGLAAWRMGDCAGAGEAFGNVGSRASDVELMAAGQYWAARADMLCGRPERVQPRLRTAARLGETFYGMLAARALGMKESTIDNAGTFTRADWRVIADRPNVRAAIAAAEIGETGVADELIRHQARIGSAREHEALLHLAARLSLPTTQVWLAHNAPRGTQVDPLARYPAPDWQPARGWRVDQALVFALALQESNFRAEAVSPAGARGLMQVMPGTANQMARRRGEGSVDPSRLNDPVTNMEFGQEYMEFLRDFQATGGLLPKVIAAYNAGPAPLSDWNSRPQIQHDPLLYIESIPYWETRGYVPIVLRNYWVYEQKLGRQSASREAMVQGLWPRFPGMPGPNAVRIDPRPGGGQMASAFDPD